MNQRIEFALRALETDNFRVLCREYGISTKTGYKWRERFIRHGTSGMEEASRRPRSSPGGLAEGVVCEMIRIKRQHLSWGPRKVRAVYARTHGEVPSESSVKRVLQRAGYTEQRRVRRQEEAGRLFSGRRATGPNEVWTVDFKGWWYGVQGGRCEPLTVRDEFSRYVLEVRAVPDARAQTVRECFERLFERHGMPEALRTDNGAPFAQVRAVLGLTRLSAWWVALGIDLERGRPGCPQDNGGHERLHLDLAREVESQRLGERQPVLDEWRCTFNEERPHEALAMRTPAEVYTNSTRRFEGTPADLTYAGMDTRKVQTHGNIGWAGQTIFISTALQGWSVGLKPSTQHQLWEVWFGRLLLGRLDAATASFQRAQGGEQISPGHSPGKEEG